MNDFAKRRTWGPNPKYPLMEAYLHPVGDFISIAGPCSVESPEQIFDLAESVATAGATHLRGGLFRAGTFPGQHYGPVDQKLVEAFAEAARKFKLKTVIEILSYEEFDFDRLYPYADVVQIGARAMQNYELLNFLGRIATHDGKEIFLKRHPGCTIDEFLGAGEWILRAGTTPEVGDKLPHLRLIERGSTTHSKHVRWDLSISMIPAIGAISQVPVIVDASHGTGRRDLVLPMTLAGVAAGAAGTLVEVHRTPDKSMSDPEQAITPAAYRELMQRVKAIREIVRRPYVATE